MCAVFGLIDYSNHFSARQRGKIMRTLSIECEERGTDATGFAFNKNNHLAIYKRPLPAHQVHLHLPREANVILGHTRMETQGRREQNYNNHPFRGYAGGQLFALAHNGILYNDDLLRDELLLPGTKIKTDSYIAVQLLERLNKFDMESLAKAAEMIAGTFVFTLLDENNNSYFIRGENPLAIYHFESFGFYIYASTDSILLSAIEKLDLAGYEYTEVKTWAGDILRIDSDGNMERAEFDTANCFDWGYSCFSCYPIDEENNSPAVRQLKEFAEYMGLGGKDVDMLLMFGYSVDEIEELLYDPEELEIVLLDNPCLSLDDILKKEHLIMDVSRFNLLTRCEFSDMFDEVSAGHDHINSQEYPVCEVGYVRGYYRNGWEDVYFPVHEALLTPEVKEEANALYNTVIHKWFPMLGDLVHYCEENAEEQISENSYNFYVVSNEANYWLRFITRPNDYNIYMHIFKKGVRTIEE